eukprot:TRINITY_DN71668_c0_g1_i1.p2 TRINITY_DN71668_c0_g1~~TRINITY_DN71668_c0_g1_i1.p2  ORF type:complete len:186 (-),score=56.94 TRINITY_DN71668_c0_g1_i1:96-587(-)
MAAAPELHPCKIFVGNLPYSATTNALAGLFRPFGTVVGAKLIEDRATGKKKGFGFVTFTGPDAVEAAIARRHGEDFEGRPLTVRRATMRGEKGDPEADDDEADAAAGAEGAAAGEDDGWATGGAGRRKGRGSASAAAEFRARAEAKKKEGKMLGWGGDDDDWA